MAIKMIAMDLDDTLLDPTSKITLRTKEALQEAMRRGVTLVLASGRMPTAMRAIAEELEVNGAVIAFNGALTTNLFTGRDIVRMSIEKPLVKEAAALGESFGAHVQVFANNTYYYAEENIYAQRYAASINQKGHAVGMPVSQWADCEADKILVIEEPANIANWVKVMQEHFGDRLHCAISRPNYIEVFNHKADKAVALKAYSEQIGLTVDEVAAFGDGENDLTMIDFAGHGYVMANAREPILKRAKLVAPSNAVDGLARVVENWFTNGMIPEV